MSKAIQAIPTASVAKICSGQVILDLSTAVKELVENALDAGASSVEVRLREHGLQLIEVADNGKGVPPEDHAALALKYHTSKISQFQDLEGLHTFGFRGEALSSLAALGELSVITRTAGQAAATRLDFDRDGRLTSSTLVARAVGTTVAVKDLFAALPVRRQEFTRNVRREVAKLKLLLQQYAIMSTQAQLFASDQAGKAARTVLVSTSNAGSGLCERVSAVLGSKVAAVLVPIEVKLQEEGVTITGLVSRAGCGVKGDKLRQFCCINGRPVELPRAIKILNDTYKSLYSSLVGLRPMAFLCFELPAGTFDINVTPDKRSVFVQKEVAIANALGQALQALWEPSRYSYAVNTTQAAFDTQRTAQPATQQPPAAAAAAAAAADCLDGEEGDGNEGGDGLEDTDHTQKQQQQQQQEEEGNAGSDSDDEAVGAQGRAAQRLAAGVPSLSSFGIGAPGPQPAAAAAAAPARASSPQHSTQVQHEDRQLAAPASAASAAAIGVAAGGSSAAAAAAAAGQKRLRPLEAALLGRKVPRQHGSSEGPTAAAATAAATAAAAAAAAADGSLDVTPGAAAAAGLDAIADVAGAGVTAAAGSAAAGMQQQQQRQQRVVLPLSSFQLGGSSGSLSQVLPGVGVPEGQPSTQAAAGGDAATATAAAAAAAGGGVQGGGISGAGGRRGGSSGSGQQPSLAAFGFRVLADGDGPRQQQQQQQQQTSQEGSGAAESDLEEGPFEDSQQERQQQQQQRGGQGPIQAAGRVVGVCEGSEKGGQDVEVVDMAGSESEGSEGDEGDAGEDDEGRGIMRVEQQQQQQQGPAGAGSLEEETEDVVLVEDLQQQQQGQGRLEQQQQQQRQQLVVVDYDMDQLMADFELQMQQLQQQQPAAGGEGGGAAAAVAAAGGHSTLAAASLQGAVTPGEGGGAAGISSSTGDLDPQPGAADPSGTAAAAAAAANDAATCELMRVFNKADFAEMQAVGQFNLGFIIARLRGDLFIVDQHAADEKSTFERLMCSYSVNKQPLLQPRRLNTLTHMDQQTIRDHMDIFKRNGFDFVERDAPTTTRGGQQQQQQQRSSDQQRLWSKPPRSRAAAAAAAAAAAGTEEGDQAAAAAAAAAPTAGVGLGVTEQTECPQSPLEMGGFEDEGCVGSSELLLSAVPVLKGGVSGGGALGEEVLLELLDLIAAGETRPEDIRPKKVRDVLASRACRTSIMIGSPLTRQQQGRILARLAQLDAPFNCPHGRPTMRHLAVLPEQQQQQPDATQG